jgi:hypothetical protein
MLNRTATFGLKALSVSLLLCAGGQASAAQASFCTHVGTVLMSADKTWGGCMALLYDNPATFLPTCSGGWVTFSCSGDFTDRVRAYRMADQAQLAVATGNKICLTIQDDKKHNGYCFANRIDVHNY